MCAGPSFAIKVINRSSLAKVNNQVASEVSAAETLETIAIVMATSVDMTGELWQIVSFLFRLFQPLNGLHEERTTSSGG